LTAPAQILLALALAAAVLAAPAEATPEPLALEVAVSLRSHNGRSSFQLSPDGEWLAHTVSRAERLPRATPAFSDTGKPFGEGGSRMQASLTHVRTGEVVRLGGAAGSSWAPVWSPDGERVAFYADDDGEAGVWIWEKASGRAWRFPGVVARPFFGFEVPRWSPDGRRLLSKVLPTGMSVAEANALVPAAEEGRRYPPHGPDEPSVFVLSAEAKDDQDEGKDGETEEPPAPEADPGSNRSFADLAILDLEERTVTRIVERGRPRWYAFSPDGKRVAYTELKGFAATAQQPFYDIGVYEPAGGERRTLATDVPLAYGIELSWSPDGRSLAYIASGQLGDGAIVLVSVADGAARDLGGDAIASFDLGDGERAPLWDAAGETLYALGADGKLWRVGVGSGKGTAVGEVPGHRIRAVVARHEPPTMWTTGGGHTAWVLVRERDTQRDGIARIDLETGGSEVVLLEEKSYATTFNVDASDATGEIAYVARGQRDPGDAWIFDTETGRTRQASHLNPELEGYELGSARVLEYLGVDGQELRAALLLPPGYEPGRRLPLFVWVYGGDQGSDFVNRFGFWGDLATLNMHVLATRGFAVLYPDTPLRPGRPTADLLQTVMPAVNAAVEQGYADPERLAVGGQSYGAYSTLALVTQTTRFKAAILTAAVLHPDLFASYLEMRPDGTASWIGYFEHGQGGMEGSIWERRDRYFENSPIFRFDRIETPVLIGQGDEDVGGGLTASDAVFVALRRLGKAVEYRVYEDEGHVITRAANVIDFWLRRLDFLAEHLDLARDERGRVDFDGDRPRPRQAPP
jgi:dipeptidyl aminopeptidase/acylaminoacyl peptidase